MGKVLNWMHHDSATDVAKEESWRAVAGSQAPQRAWYYSSSFREGDLGSLLVPLRDVFWSPASKSRVVKDVDVKVEHLSVLPGVPILRVTMPERMVASFVAGDSIFVLYKAMHGDKMVDFGHEWGGLRSSVRGASMTVVGNVGNMMDGMDTPPTAGLLAEAEKRAILTHPVLPPRTRVAPALLTPARLPPPPVSPVEVPQPPPAIPDPTDAEPPPEDPTTETPVPPPAPRVTTRIARRVRPPHSDGWVVFGGRPEALPPPPPKVLGVTPATAPKPDEDDGLPEDTSDRTFHIVAALMAVLVFLLIGSYFLSAS